MAPARILPCQAQHQDPHVGRHGRASSSAGRLPPLPAHKRAMPPQQRARGDQAPAARGAWQLARRRREQGTVRGAKLRPRDLATQNLELVAQDQQLDVLDVQATATANECAQQGPEREVEKRKATVADPPSPRADGARQDYWRPSGLAEGETRRRFVVCRNRPRRKRAAGSIAQYGEQRIPAHCLPTPPAVCNAAACTPTSSTSSAPTSAATQHPSLRQDLERNHGVLAPRRPRYALRC
jgi:hypothetical protein